MLYAWVVIRYQRTTPPNQGIDKEYGQPVKFPTSTVRYSQHANSCLFSMERSAKRRAAVYISTRLRGVKHLILL
jgi:hypothetical protein